jgi:hypothetical protein
MSFFIKPIYAQEQPPSYVIQIEQIEASPEAKMSSISEEVQTKLNENGFVILPQQKDSAFTFSISDTNMDFSDIISTRQKANSALLKVNSPETFSYQLVASLEQPFQSSLQEIIPQTSCDENTPCAYEMPNKWMSNDSYGWGFHLSGPDVVTKFNDDTYYEIFDESKQMIVSQNEAVTGESATKITLKAQVPVEQKEGNYNAIIKLIAIPKL